MRPYPFSFRERLHVAAHISALALALIAWVFGVGYTLSHQYLAGWGCWLGPGESHVLLLTGMGVFLALYNASAFGSTNHAIRLWEDHFETIGADEETE